MLKEIQLLEEQMRLIFLLLPLKPHLLALKIYKTLKQILPLLNRIIPLTLVQLLRLLPLLLLIIN